MREFGKTPKKSKFLRFLETLIFMIFGNNNHQQANFNDHFDRMESRRRKTLFDKRSR